MTKEDLKLIADRYPLSESTLLRNKSHTCLQCGAEFTAYSSHGRKFCSQECAYANPERVAHVKPKDRGSSVCDNCGRSFKITRNHLTKRLCSQECARSLVGKSTIIGNRRVKPSPTFKCLSCGNIFSASPSSRRKFCSIPCSIKSARSNTRFKHGWVDVGGRKIFVRSSWESNYAFYLEFQKNNGLILEWEYEPETFWFKGIKRGACSYLPDFRITTKDGVEYHEVKGWLDDRSATKLRRMAKYHPSVKIVLIDSKRYSAINRIASSVVPGWSKKR